MNNLLYIRSFQLAIAINIKFQKFSSQHLLVSCQSCINKTCNELRIVYKASIIKIHCCKYLINFLDSKRKVKFFLELLESYYHFLSSYHSIPVRIKSHKYFSQMFNLFLRNIDSQMHQNGLLQTRQIYLYSFIFTSLLRPMITYQESLNY